MSEYQYYEFVAIDRPLTAKQMAALRAISTRAEITSSRFQNEYQWGDLKADPAKLMERYFDAHLNFAAQARLFEGVGNYRLNLFRRVVLQCNGIAITEIAGGGIGFFEFDR